MGTRLFLVRHAETVWSAKLRIHGRSDPALSELGHRQAKAVGDMLAGRPLAAIYTSPLQRARQTAAAIAARHQVQPRADPAFQEVSLGVWEGQRIADLEADDREHYARWLAAPTGVRPPGGETLEEARARVARALASLQERHADETVVLVTHSIVGRIVIATCLGIDVRVVPRLKLKVASLSILRLEPSGGVLERLGDVSHLKTIVTVEKLAAAEGTPRPD